MAREIMLSRRDRIRVLRGLTQGLSERAISDDREWSRSTLSRYRKRYPRFARRALEARALFHTGATDEEIADFVAQEPHEEPDPRTAKLPPPSLPVHQAPEKTLIIEPEVMDDDDDGREQGAAKGRRPRQKRSYEAFLDKSYEYFTDDTGNTPLALRIASQRALGRHYSLMTKRDTLIDMQRAERGEVPPGQTAKGLMASAIEHIANAIVGPPSDNCPACGRKFWRDTSGGMRPHFDEVDPRADGWAREAKSLGAEGLCPGVAPDVAEAAE